MDCSPHHEALESDELLTQPYQTFFAQLEDLYVVGELALILLLFISSACNTLWLIRFKLVTRWDVQYDVEVTIPAHTAKLAQSNFDLLILALLIETIKVASAFRYQNHVLHFFLVGYDDVTRPEERCFKL